MATFQAIEKGIAHSGIDLLTLTRLMPLFPYNIQNHAYRATTILFWSFTVVLTLTTLPGIFIYVLTSHELVDKGITLVFIGKLSVVGLALFTLVQVAKAWARYKHIDPSVNREYAGK